MAKKQSKKPGKRKSRSRNAKTSRSSTEKSSLTKASDKKELRSITFDTPTLAAMQACVDHASDLLSSARAVLAEGHHNIAYHLAALALEEVGRRSLIGVQKISAKSTAAPTWPHKHTQSHTQKLFWCFFGASLISEKVTPAKLEEMRGLASHIHSSRLAGLYVHQDDNGFSIPSDAISREKAESLFKLAEASLGLAASEKLREDVTQEEIELQAWFLRASDDADMRRQVFSEVSLQKLTELKDAQAWARWLREQFEKAEAEGKAAAESEIQRGKLLPHGATSKDKWKVRFRLISQSHSVRPKALSAWNAKVDWIKLHAVSGKKDQIHVDLILKDQVPVQGLWYFAWGIARHFATALNIGTMGFWWWRMPEQIDRFYEKLEDLERKQTFLLERKPSLKIDWGENRVLTDEDIDRVIGCFVSLPGPEKRDQHAAYNYYIGGMTFLSLNDIHWQCESTVFGNFFECLKAMMTDAGDWEPNNPFEPSMLNFLDELFPKLEERDRFAEICSRFETGTENEVQITLKEASFMKLFCDAYFLRTIQPKALQENMENIEREDTNEGSAETSTGD